MFGMMASEKTPLIRAGGLAEQGGASEQLNKASISTTKSKKQPKFNWLFLKRLYLVLRVAVPGLCSKSLLLLTVLILARSAEEYNYYQMGIIPSKFYLALTSKNMDIFKEALWKMAVIITSVCICKSGGELVAGLVYVRWRATITRYLHVRYFSGITYYILNTTDRRIDNPDQRITQDVDRFCNQISQLLPKIIIQPFLIAYYSYKTFVGLGWYGVLGVYLFFALSTFINKFIMNPIVSVIFQQERKEGDFRFHHTQVRANAEAIAFYRGGENEREKANKLLRVLLKTQLRSVHWQFPLNFSVFMFDYASTVISYSLIGVAVFTGKYENMTASDLASNVSMNSFFSLYLLNGFSKIVDTAVSFAEVAGFTHRLGELIEVLKEMEREEKRSCDSGSGDKEEESGGLEGMANKSQPSDCQLSAPGSAPPLLSKVPPACLETVAMVNNLTLSPPHSKHTLAKDLSFNFTKGCNILILGETGTGKTALLRVLRKLWEPVTGRAQLCCDGSHHYVMFLPQKTYLTSGSLASQIAYPESPKEETESNSPTLGYRRDNIDAAIEMAGLAQLRNRLGGATATVAENWYDIVSPGEAQRISFARLFYHQPPFAFLDEATSALSEETECVFYSTLKSLNITLLSVGHRSSLKQFHHQLLTIQTDGLWTMQESY